jgi:hypothetical protein
MVAPRTKRRISIQARVCEAVSASAVATILEHMLRGAESDPEVGSAAACFFGVGSLDEAEFELVVKPVESR